jgi:hypothetical protein
MKTLISDIELFAAMLFQVRVTVCAKDSAGHTIIVDYGGPIERYTDISVRIGGENYTRSAHEFRAETRY